MQNHIGRPATVADGIDTTFTLNKNIMDITSAGAEILGQLDGKRPSRAAWIRYLIRHAIEGKEIATIIKADQLTLHWPSIAPSQLSKIKATYRLEERHRILLRQFECYAQSLNWSLPLYRNEALQLLILVHGPQTNTTLKP